MFIDKLPGTDNALETKELINKLIAAIVVEIEAHFDQDVDRDDETHAKNIVQSYKDKLAEKTEIRMLQPKLLQEAIVDYLNDNDLDDVPARFEQMRGGTIDSIENIIYKVFKKFADDKK